MKCHPNARLAPAGRARVFAAVEAGMTVRAACMAFRVSRRWYYRWLPRWQELGAAGLVDRSSRPRRCPRQLGEEQLVQIRALRLGLGWGSDRIAAALRLNRSTVQRAITRLGLKAAKPFPLPVQRYVYERPGGLLHIDIKKLGRIGAGAGHRATGTRARQHRMSTKGFGWEYLYVALDDATRVVYCEVLTDERGATGVLFLLSALRWFRDQGVQVERLLTDNGTAFRGKAMARACRRLGVRHIFTRPYHPQTNGKVERWIRTALTECLYLEVFNSAPERLVAVRRFVRYYNHHRPHLALAGSTPAAVLHQRLAS